MTRTYRAIVLILLGVAVLSYGAVIYLTCGAVPAWVYLGTVSLALLVAVIVAYSRSAGD